ncbi:MAG TPA: DUF4760 domain-containing protein [Alphaproteobacteria bacterium]|nr:DUF4760 domain-containing protein [Alphaproteobacteria bacterium]
MSHFGAVYHRLKEAAAIAPLGVAFAALFGLVIAFRQSREASRARRLAATKLLLDEIGNAEVREARTRIMETATPLNVSSPDAELGGELSKSARRVGVAYDRIGVMIRQGLIDEDMLFDSQCVEIEVIWRKIEPLVTYIRNQQRRPNYLFHFEFLATEWLPKMNRARGRAKPAC